MPQFETPVGNSVGINGELTIYTAAERLQLLTEQLGQYNQLSLDLAAVTEIDSAGIQLLLLLKKAADEQQKSLQFINHSEPLLIALKTLNLMSALGAPEAA